MSNLCRAVILSDIHYAGPLEQARGSTEALVAPNPAIRLLLRAYRYYIWRRDPMALNYFLDDFLGRAEPADLVIANGDFSCDTGFVGVSDDAAFQSASVCLAKLREKFGPRLRSVIGDHELGKMSLAGGMGGLRLESWRRTLGDLDIAPLWRLELGRYHLIGVASSLIALPVYETDTLPSEREEWQRIREAHFRELHDALQAVPSEGRIILFCHDPTALPFLAADPVFQNKLSQVEQTIIGHLHSPLLLWKSRLLSGLPPISWCGNAVLRMSTALSKARDWKNFNLRLCPALAGIQLLNDGGFLRMNLDPDGDTPARFEFIPLKRR